MTEDDIARSVAEARLASGTWGGSSFRERGALLRKLRNLIVERTDRIASEISSATGKTRMEAILNEIVPTLETLKFLENNSAVILSRQKRPTTLSFPGSTAYLDYHPFGVVLVLAPWNFPFQLAMVPIVTALAAGNAVLFKPSELTPQTGALIENLLRDAGLPAGVISVFNGGWETGEKLVDSKPDLIVLTGSAATGKRIMASAAKNLTPLLFELGGKDPMIVFEDANLERAANAAVYGAFANAGQICVSVERLYVQEEIFDSFIGMVCSKTNALRLGTDDDADIGPMTSERQIRIVDDQLDDALQRGAVFLTERKKAGSLCWPVVMRNVTNDMRVMREETFGPVLPAMAFKDEEDAVRLANATEFGLNASVWTRDLKKARRVAARLVTGNCAINDVIKNIGNPHLPFGGVKQSGFGHIHGPEGLRAFCRTQAVMVNAGNSDREMNWFPYDAALRDGVRIFLHMFFLKKPFFEKAKGLWGYLKFYRRNRKTKKGSRHETE